MKIIEEPISDTSATTTTTIRPTESVTKVTTSIKEEEQPQNTALKSVNADDEDENEAEDSRLPKNNVLESFEFSEFVRGGNHKPLDLRK